MQTEKEIFENNIKALEKILMPEYIQIIKDAELPKWAKPIVSKDGTNNLLITHGVQKKSLYPMEGWYKEIDPRIETANFSSSTASMIIGIGLGFYLDAALEKADKEHKFLIVEPDAGILKLALSECDFSKAIIDKQIIFAPASDDVAFSLELMNEKYVVDDWSIMIEGYTINHPSYLLISFDAINLLNQIRCNIGTVCSAGKKIADNDIANLPYTIHRRGVNELKDLYKGLPAIIVSTGPSLQKNLHYLIDNQDKVIIVAVGQALRPLLSYGIRSDFICSVDFGDVNLTHYDGLMCSDVPLVALNQSYDGLLKRWQGPMFVSTSPFVATHPDHENRIHKILNDKGSLAQGGSVSHMCFGLALSMGCNPIIIIGQDLAYDNDQSHFQQADSGGVLKTLDNGEMKWEVQDPRCHLHGKNYSMGTPILVEGYFLKEVKTNVGLASFITSFERIIKNTPNIKAINATEGGAHIPGTIRMSLKKALKEYCSNTIANKAEKLNMLLSDCDDAMTLIRKSIPLLQQEIQILNKITSHCKMALNSNKKLKKLLNFKPWNNVQKLKFMNILDKNSKHSTEAHQETMKMPLVKLAIYGANRQIRNAKMMIKVDDSFENIDKKENQENFKIRIERNEIILKAALDASKTLKKTYTEVLDRLRQADSKNNTCHLFNGIPESLPNINDCDEYFKVGNFARPMLEAKRILKDPWIWQNRSDDFVNAEIIYKRAEKMRDEAIQKAKELPDQSNHIDHIQLIYDAHKIGRDEKDFSKALDMLKKAYDLKPDSSIVKWGLASAYFHTKQYEKSAEIYEALIQENDNPRYLFELGQVFIYDNKVEKGIEHVLKAMEKTSEFDSFLCILGDILCGFKKFEDGIKYYEDYLEKFPADYEVWVKLSKAYEELHWLGKAQESIDMANSIMGE